MEAAHDAARAFVGNQSPAILAGAVAFSRDGLSMQPPSKDQQGVLDMIDRRTS